MQAFSIEFNVFFRLLRFDYNDPDFEMILESLEYIFKNAGLHLPENFMPILGDILPYSQASIVISVTYKSFAMRTFLKLNPRFFKINIVKYHLLQIYIS